MSDIEELLAGFEAGTLLRPSTEFPNIVDLSRALAWLLGAQTEEISANSSALAGLIGHCDHLILILADGLGMNLVERLPASAFLSAHLRGELRTVFPSSTGVALTTIATGDWPNRHGVTGQWTHLPELRNAGALLPFTVRSGGRALSKVGVTVEQAFPLPTILSAVDRDVFALFPTQMVKSISSTYFAGHRARGGYRTLSEAVDIILARVNAARAPTYTYLYTPQVDLEAHWHGVGHPTVQGAIVGLGRQVERLAAGVAGRARIVLTADHGLLDAPVDARKWVKPSSVLFESLLYPPSGDARVMYLHLREGAEEQIRLRFGQRYGENFFLISIEEAERLELFGPGPISRR